MSKAAVIGSASNDPQPVPIGSPSADIVKARATGMAGFHPGGGPSDALARPCVAIEVEHERQGEMTGGVAVASGPGSRSLRIRARPDDAAMRAVWANAFPDVDFTGCRSRDTRCPLGKS
jgi:hypothetical protein